MSMMISFFQKYQKQVKSKFQKIVYKISVAQC